MKKLTMLITIFFLGFCIPKKMPQLIPLALLGSLPKVTPYSLEDIGITDDGASNSSLVVATSGLPLISQGERMAMENAIQEFADAGLMTKEYWENSGKETMNLLAEEGLSADQITEVANLIVEGKEVPARTRASREEVTRRETAKASEYFGKIQANLPELTKEQLVLLRQNLTVSLAIIRLQRDYNPPDGIPTELLTNMRDKTIEIRKAVTKEMENKGMKSL